MISRLLLLSTLALAAFAADVSGTWKAEVETPMGTGSPTFVLKQNGESLTGTYSGALGEAPLKGTVKGNAIEFQFKINPQGEDMVIIYKGTIESTTTMKGTAKFADLGEGTWKAQKEK
jgi:hypothetical protein